MTDIYQSRSYSLFQKSLIFTGICLSYFLSGWTSLNLATINEFASPIWSPSGIATGALVIFGTGFAPAVFLGAFLTNLTVSQNPLSLLSIATGNMLEAVVGAAIIMWVMRKNFFKNYSEFMSIVLVAILASSVSATFGTSTLLFNQVIHPVDYGYVWYTWWSGDAVGIMMFLPIFMEFFFTKDFEFVLSARRLLTSLIFLAIIVAATFLVFVKDYNQAFSWVMCPILILSGMVLGKFISRLLLISIAFMVVILTTQGYGPFEFGSLNLNLIYVQSLLVSYSFAVLFVRPLSNGLKSGLIFSISNIIGWTCIFGVIYMSASVEEKHLVEGLQSAVNGSIEDLQEATHHYELLLKGGEALLQIKPKLTQTEWRDYVSSLNLKNNYDAINGFGFIRSIPRDKEQEFLGELKDQGINNFTISELNNEFSHQFSHRFVITLVEPFELNHRARGFDIGSELNRREAALKSKEENITVATREIQLVQDELKRPAFLLLHPVWNQTKEFQGWTYAPVLSDIFYKKAFSHFSHLLNVKLKRDDKDIYLSGTEDKIKFNSYFKRTLSLKIFGNDTKLEFYPTTEFFTRHSHSSAPLALVLSLFMLFIAGFLLEQLTFGQRTEALVKKRTKELEESKIQLINSSKMASLGEMASGMAHEINNPITIILGKIKVISVMLEDLNVKSQPLNDEISRIEHTTDRIGKIIKGLKSFSRAAHNDPFELVPVETIIQETLDLCSERLKANGIKMQIEKIPQICLYCRPSQISQVLLNMFNNSSDALTDIKEKVITLNFEIREPDRLFIYVSDTGPGIHPDIASKIMDPFFTTKGVGKGTGLGLSIAKGIIEGHGGSLWLDEKSLHTRFVLEFPIRPV